MVQFDATIIIQFILFLSLLAILNKIFFQPLIKVQVERQEAIDKASDTAQAKREELKTLKADYQERLDGARQGAFDAVSHEIDSANAKRKETLDAVQAEVEQQLSEAKAALSEQEETLRQALKKEIAPLAQTVLDRLITVAEVKEEVEV